MIEIRIANENDAAYIALLGRTTYTVSHGEYIHNKQNLLDFYVGKTNYENLILEKKNYKNERISTIKNQ